MPSTTYHAAATRCSKPGSDATSRNTSTASSPSTETRVHSKTASTRGSPDATPCSNRLSGPSGPSYAYVGQAFLADLFDAPQGGQDHASDAQGDHPLHPHSPRHRHPDLLPETIATRALQARSTHHPCRTPRHHPRDHGHVGLRPAHSARSTPVISSCEQGKIPEGPPTKATCPTRTRPKTSKTLFQTRRPTDAPCHPFGVRQKRRGPPLPTGISNLRGLCGRTPSRVSV